MNKLNSKLYYVISTIALALLSLSVCFTLYHFFTYNTYDVAFFDPFKVMTAQLTDMYFTFSSLLPDLWSVLQTSNTFYIDLISGYVGDIIATLVFFMIGALLVFAGIMSKPSGNCKGPESDPREYMFTHRRFAPLKVLAMPWNIIPALWSHKKVPVIIPIIFLPLMVPFALYADVIVIVVYAIMAPIMALRIKLAAKKDREKYDAAVGIAICPKCKRTFYQPKVRCKCGSVFEYPVPDKHGLTEHTCNKGHVMPCTNANGARGRLQCVCPHCNEDIPSHEARPVVFSMVGAVGAGKTALIVSAAESIAAKAKSKAFITELATPGITPNMHAIKDVLPPTVAGELDTECMFVWSRELDARELMFNDISGTEFEPREDKVIFQDYYKYTDGFVFAIDPMAVMAFHKSDSPIKSNKTTVSGTLESFYNTFAMVTGTSPSTRSGVPVAVVLTKMDNPRVSAAIRDNGAEGFLREHGEGDFVKNLQIMFTDVKYFTVSSIGADANAADPFLWITAKKDREFVSKLS